LTDQGGITIVRCGGVAEHWKNVIRRCERGEAEVLKAEGGASVLALPGEAVRRGASAGLVIKRWELRSIGARVKSGLRMSRAWRHWKGAERLTKAGVRTATCYAIARSKKDGVAVEWLVMDRLPGKTLLRHMAERDLTHEQEHKLAEALGATIGKLTNAGIYNRDGKPSNWIVTDPSAAGLAVIDTVGVRWGHPPRASAMLTSLMLEALGCGVAPRRALRWRAVRAFDRAVVIKFAGKQVPLARAYWEWTADDIAKHGDPTPKVNPLG